jgi:hypothetical protein
MRNVPPSAPLLTSSKTDRVVLETARRLTPANPYSVTARSIFDEQLEDPDYIRYLDELAIGYGFL